ncbi:MAG: glycosyltransferase family 2 protein [Myxococcota bacterium]|nr:glycosyltransferase family 2 protein [Myxococcota bacterium]
MTPCLAIPIFNHGASIERVVESLRPLDLPCIIVNDGSDAETRLILSSIEEKYSWVELIHHPANQGRGSALRTAYQAALDRGFSHVVQVDADGQHDTSDIPLFLECAQSNPEALVLGKPVFDDSVPWHRLHGRKLSQIVVWIETLSTKVADPLCGFRCIPLGSAIPVIQRQKMGDRMDFDPEFIIRMVRAGVPVENIPTSVRYPDSGVSHFRMGADNFLIALAYMRLAGESLTGIFSRRHSSRSSQ